jgi:2-polyprenyl-3-methyl-5-hydroxy-6-metoxy-1,4-benzoquinol methylase
MSMSNAGSCNVCGTSLGIPVYRSDARSLTSLSEVYDGTTEVSFCERCGHLQTNEIQDIKAYYDTQYNILSDSEDEDTLYRVVDGRKVFRVEHQVDTILRKIDLPMGARVLDYGCAKSATSRKLLERRPDLRVHLFDVSKAYVQFWKTFISPDRWATYAPNPDWMGTFDAVLSFYALEHVAAPRSFALGLAQLLKDGGHLHLLVPNVYANSADFVVADHVNHFSASSLRRLLGDVGFESIQVDGEAHDAAWVVTAQKASASSSPSVPDLRDEGIADLRSQVDEMSRFWAVLAGRIRAFESEHAERRATIYGSGFYGTFIASCLASPSRVECFLDQNPFRQTKRHLDKPILAPERIDAGIDVVYVGLNPRISRATIEALEVFRGRDTDFFYL